LTNEVGEDHHCTVADESRPGRTQVTIDKMIRTQWYPPEIKYQGDQCTDNRQPCSPIGLGCKLIPDGEVVIDSQEEVRHHQNRNDSFAFPIFFPDEKPHYKIIEVEHGGKKYQGDRDDEEIHDPRIGLFGIFLFSLCKKERLRRILICLYKDGHQDRDLVTGAVDPDLVGRDIWGKQVTKK